MSYLLDTNVISEIRRGRDRNVAAWAGEVTDPELHLSVLTLGEIREGIERLRRRDLMPGARTGGRAKATSVLRSSSLAGG
jgi:predicted nucleic acid-binding protein